MMNADLIYRRLQAKVDALRRLQAETGVEPDVLMPVRRGLAAGGVVPVEARGERLGSKD